MSGEQTAATRRGLGIIYIVSGLLFCGLMVFATLYSLGKIHLRLPSAFWSRLYGMHFAATAVSCVLFVALEWRRTRSFTAEIMADLAIAPTVFALALLATGLLLVRGTFTPWISLAPGLFLVYYGWRMAKGKPVWLGLGRLPKP